MQQSPYPTDPDLIRNIALDIVITILTCGLWNLMVQYKQMQAVNMMLGHQKYKFLPWFLLSIITCGLYHIYHEYVKSTDIFQITKSGTEAEPIAILVLTLFGLHFIADALQQTHINRYLGGGDVL